MIEDNELLPEEKEEIGATYGTGEQFVEVPDKPGQVEKLHPKDELSQKVGTPDGRVFNLETGDVTRPETIEISGRTIDVSEFGDKGLEFIAELYEQWLFAADRQMASTFTSSDEWGVDSSKIIDEAKQHYDRWNLSRMLKERTVEKNGEVTKESYVVWDRHSELEQWVAWTAATLRWRINYEIERRRFLMGLSFDDILTSKKVCEEALVVCEKWLNLSENKRLTSV